MKYLLCLIFTLSVITCSHAQKASDRKAILKVLDEQTENWNKGRLEKFMQGYWQSDSLMFVGRSGITYGWQNVLNNYETNYPDKDHRGTLRFEIVKVDLLSKDAAYVVGRFFLTRPKAGDANGHFTLLWRKIRRKWVIVSDHSS
jgi:hypothetical protein